MDDDEDSDGDSRRQMLKILASLEKSVKVQQNSSDLMTYLVQDLLDFAQLKSGKFRKNISKFNIRDTVDKVITI